MNDEPNLTSVAPLADDLLTGATEIAQFLGLRRSRVYALLNAEAVPAFRLGSVWQARRSTLVRHFAALEARSAAGPLLSPNS